jgi:hypothetical protein
MLNERTADLARRCTQLIVEGNGFPTVWNGVLKSHPLVGGIPRQRLQGARTTLDIPLVTGQVLVFDAEAKEFRLE